MPYDRHRKFGDKHRHTHPHYYPRNQCRRFQQHDRDTWIDVLIAFLRRAATGYVSIRHLKHVRILQSNANRTGRHFLSQHHGFDAARVQHYYRIGFHRRHYFA
jgi:hypothetical protein